MGNFTALFHDLPGKGWLEEREAKLLLQSADSTEGTILEVGCYYGRSTVLLASLGRPVISVDPFEKFDTSDPAGNKIHEEFLSNLKSRDIHNVTLYRQRIEDWERVPVGFAYLDGEHTHQGTLNQIAAAIECGAAEICAHDYDTQGDGQEIKKAIDEHPQLEVVTRVIRMVRCKVQ